MRFVPRDVDFTSLASSLSLVVANYKPVPQLPSASSAISAGGAHTFQVQASGAANNHSDVSDWGIPSVLYVPKTGERVLASTQKIGPGKCPVQQPYTPNGGASALPDPIFPAFDPVKANVMRYRQQQGVNLGAWFMLEGWMQSNLFSCATGNRQAEYDVLDGFGQSAAGVRSAKAYMEKHWDTWITEDDFKRMAAQGINTVRLPIGYFSVGPWFTRNSPFAAYSSVYENTWRYIARAINWAAKYDIGVIVDLHGAYGSQNGQLHSGLSDGNIEFYNDYNMGLTTDLLVWLAAEISDVTNVVGIQLLNEPQDRSSLWPWYTKTMNAMRKASPAAATVPLYFHDAFNLNKGAAFVAKRSDFIVQDHHAYYVYTPADTSLSAKGHTKAISGAISDNMNAQSKIARRNLIIGEWSCALNPNSLSKSSNRERDQTNFCQAQADVYAAATAGWTFWSWKLEGCSNNGGWCFQQAAKQYLPSTYDSWGLQSVTSALLRAASSSDDAAKKKVTTLLATIAAIPLPSAASLNLKALVNSDDDSKSDLLSIDESGSDNNGDDDADAAATSTELPRIGKVVSTSAQETSTVNVQAASKEGARVGMVVKSRSGSLAARAAAIVKSELAQLARRQATSRSALASRAGYSDGFKTARYFASNGGLSRLGFAQQYMQDSWQARLATGKVDAGDSAGYLSQFKAGLLAAETAIVKSIQSTA